MKKSYIFIAIFLILSFLIYDIFLKDPWAVERLIKQGRIAAEAEDIEKGFSLISKDFKDNSGNDYEGLYKKIQKFFDDVSNLKIIILKKKKEFSASPEPSSEDRKRCDARVWIILDADFATFGPGRGQEYIKMELRKEQDKKWRLINANFDEKW